MLKDYLVFQTVSTEAVICSLPGHGESKWGSLRHPLFDFFATSCPKLPAVAVFCHLVEAAYLPLNGAGGRFSRKERAASL